MGMLGAVFMGIVVFGVNYFISRQVPGASTAAAKQAAYTFIFGGFIMKGCERIATEIYKKRTAIVLSVLVPSFIAISLTFLVHSLKGTPHPFESTIPTMILIVPATAVWGVRNRRKNDKEEINRNKVLGKHE
jgi:hypothetical protein